MKNSREILEILKRINSLPKQDAINEINSLKLKFDEWQMFTNEDLGFIRYLGDSEAKGYKDEYESKKDISYEDYLKLKNLPITIEAPKDKNIARREAKREGISEDDVKVLQEIERQWDDLVVKYDPIKEAKRAVFEAQMIIEEGINSENIEVNIADFKKDIEQYEKSISHIEEIYKKSEETRCFENGILENMKYCLNMMSDVKSQINDLSLDRFIRKYNIDKNEMLQYFKERLKIAEKQPNLGIFIKAREGKGFNLTEDGKIEIIDENMAKELMGDKYFKTFVKDNAKELERIDEYDDNINKLSLNEQNENEEETRKEGNENSSNYTDEQKEKAEVIENIQALIRALIEQRKIYDSYIKNTNQEEKSEEER